MGSTPRLTRACGRMVFWCGAACRTGAWPISRPGARRARRSRSWWPLRGGAGPSRTRSRPPGPWAGPQREPVVARLAPACLAGDAGLCPAGAGAPAGQRSAPKNGAHRQACRFPGRSRKSGASRSDWRNGAFSQPSSLLGRLGGALIKPPHNRLTSNAGCCNCNARSRKRQSEEISVILTGKTAVVTGSTSGIGLGIAETLAAAGSQVMLNGFGDLTTIETICRRLAEQHATQVAYSPADMSKPAEIRQLITEAEHKLGPVDILVINAGIQHVAPVEEFPDDKSDAILSINLSAAFHATKAALPGMKRRTWGRIINIASAHGLVASAHKAAYV